MAVELDCAPLGSASALPAVAIASAVIAAVANAIAAGRFSPACRDNDTGCEPPCLPGSATPAAEPLPACGQRPQALAAYGIIRTPQWTRRPRCGSPYCASTRSRKTCE